MTKVKKIVTIAVCLAVAAGGGTGGTLLYRSRQAKKHEVDVMPVANMVQYYWGDDLSMDGQVVSGDVQNVTPSNCIGSLDEVEVVVDTCGREKWGAL